LIAYSKDKVEQYFKKARVFGIGENKEQSQSDKTGLTLKKKAAYYCKMSEQAPATIN
jgi:phosphosulfolactate synthase (CoM biosynthesis protein A)